LCNMLIFNSYVCNFRIVPVSEEVNHETIETMKEFLSPRDLARSLGVSESSVKRWVDDGALEAVRTAGGHRRIAAAEAVRFIRESGKAADRPAELLGLVGLVEARSLGSSEELAEGLYHALVEDRPEAGRGLLISAYLAGWQLSALADGPVRTALAKIGELWRHSTEGIVVEHRAVDLVLQSVGVLRTLVRPSSGDAPPALGGAPAGDPYLLPSALASLVLADVGFRDRNLGPETPAAVLLEGARRYRPTVVWLSFSAALDEPRRSRDELLTLGEQLGELGARLAVGGRSAPTIPSGAPVLRFETMTELAAFGRGVLGE